MNDDELVNLLAKIIVPSELMRSLDVVLVPVYRFRESSLSSTPIAALLLPPPSNHPIRLLSNAEAANEIPY